MARLGETLLAEGLIDAAGLRAALESQVVNGGRLGTNLVELGLIDEPTLARTLGARHNVAYASGEMTPDPAALKVADPAFCDDADCLPMRIDATRLTVAVLDPSKLEALDQLSFRAGRRVVPVVVPEFRLHQLLRRYCKAFRPIRSIDLNVVRGPKAAAIAQQPSSVSQSDLMDEEEFQRVYARAMSGGGPASAEEEPLVGTIVEEEVATVVGELIEEPAPPPSAPAPSASTPRIRIVPAAPLSFAEAQAELARVQDREDIAAIVLRYARSKWKRALLFNVQPRLVVGWRGTGEGVDPAIVPRLALALKEDSTFRLVARTRSHYIGAVRRGAGTAVLFKQLGGGFPTTAVLMPLLVRGKPVHIVYVDSGPDQLTTPDIGELLILTQRVTRSYDELIARRVDAG